MKTKILTGLLLYISSFCMGQLDTPDSLLISLFRDKKVIYLDGGVSSGPFTLSYKDSLGTNQSLRYRNNLRTIMGLGFSYKWFSLRLATNLPIHFSSVNKNGTTTYRDLVLEFKVKRLFFDASLHSYKGYAIKDAYTWDSTLTKETYPNYILKDMRSLSISLSNWVFFNKHIDMSAIKGKKGIYLKKQKSFYIKSTVNFHGVSNEGPLIPPLKQNHQLPITESTLISSLDLGVIPGYLYVNRYKNWHYSGLLGLGGVFQSKFQTSNNELKNSFGVAPRCDLRLYIAYNIPKWFLIFSAEFENRSIVFSELSYRQNYYMFRLTGGIRFGAKKTK